MQLLLNDMSDNVSKVYDRQNLDELANIKILKQMTRKVNFLKIFLYSLISYFM